MNSDSDTKRLLHSKIEIRFFWESAPAVIKQDNTSYYGEHEIIGVIDFSFMSIARGEKVLVSTETQQSFNETQKQQARDNIGAISETDINIILGVQSRGDYVSAYLQAARQTSI